MRSLVVLVFLAGCGVDQTEFIADYAVAECDFAMACYDPAILEFRGWTDAATCVQQRGPEITGDSEGCTFDKRLAKDCLKAMKDITCPDGDPLVPEVCTQVFACGETPVDDTDT